MFEVWSAAASAEEPGELERCCEAWLTDEERQRALRFRKATSRNQHVVGRGMARKLLASPCADSMPADLVPADPASREADGGRCAPSQIVLEFTAHGKPFVVGPPDVVRPFNVAHTEGLVLFASCHAGADAAARRATIGVDVERIDRRTDVALAQRYFAPPEVQYVLDQSPGERRQAAFLRVWTLKEAFIKAVGSGLTMPLGDFAFEQIDSQRPRIRMLKSRLGSGENWQFITFSPAPGYVGAIALGDWPAAGAPACRLRCFESLLGLAAQPPGGLLGTDATY